MSDGSGTGRNLTLGANLGALAFAPDGSLLTAGDVTGRVTLWDTDVRHRAGTLRNVFPAPSDCSGTSADAAENAPFWETIRPLAFSADGTTLCAPTERKPTDARRI